MSRKSKKQAQQGTIALCITVGLIVGIGLGPIMGNVLVTAILGILVGGGVGYYFSHRRSRRHHR